MAKSTKREADFMGTKRGRKHTEEAAETPKRKYTRRAKAMRTDVDIITMPAPMAAAYRMGWLACETSHSAQ